MPTTSVAVTASPTVINALVNSIAGESVGSGYELPSQQSYQALFTKGGVNFPIQFSQQDWAHLHRMFLDWYNNKGTSTENFLNEVHVSQQADNSGHQFTVVYPASFLEALFTAIYAKWHSGTSPGYIPVTLTINNQ